MLFYGVVSSFTDRGKSSANVFEEYHDTKPDNSSKSFETRDVYIDWFDTKKQAEDFAYQARIL